MLKLTPILLALVYAFLMYRFSVWRTQKMLDQNSTINEGILKPKCLRTIHVHFISEK